MTPAKYEQNTNLQTTNSLSFVLRKFVEPAWPNPSVPARAVRSGWRQAGIRTPVEFYSMKFV